MNVLKVSLNIFLFLITSLSFSSLYSQGNSINVTKCSNGGWTRLSTSTGESFSNMGKCIAYGAQGGVYASPKVEVIGACVIGSPICVPNQPINVTLAVRIQNRGFTPNAPGTQTLYVNGESLTFSSGIMTDSAGSYTFVNSNLRTSVLCQRDSSGQLIINLESSFETSLDDNNVSGSTTETFNVTTDCSGVQP